MNVITNNKWIGQRTIRPDGADKVTGRAAFAASEDLVSGEAHLYRGILLFRRKDYGRAVRIERTFAASAGDVFDTWTSPE